MTNSRIRAAVPLLALTIALGLGACGDENDEPGTGSTPTEESPEPPADDEETSEPPADDEETTSDDAEETVVPTDDEKPPVGSDELPTNDVPEDVLALDEVQAAIQDLADRESVEADQVTAAGYFSVTWTDGSMGCPEPGMSYTQALVPGHLLVLETDGELFSYHAGRKADFTFCANPQLPKISYEDGSSTS